MGVVRIAHASISENGTIQGKAGDSTGNEVCIRKWYSRPWSHIIRCKDVRMREKIAYAMERACNNDSIGYSQYGRNTLLELARQVNYDPGKVTKPCNTDCSALVSLACIYAGIDENVLFKDNNSSTTKTLRKRLIQTNNFEIITDEKFLDSSDYLVRGDILLYEGYHVAVSLDDGNKTDSHIINGLNYSLIFDANFYSQRYADLNKVFGNDKVKLFNHFKQYGMKEGRQAIASFNVYNYKENYEDLQIAFGDELEKYYKHFMTYGYREDRKAV